ncbi:MAG: hypothetical protein GY862_27015 [Gammaproteobacteria bacterium]|nr:hypothetical protein [Gammaproteobacteria bacterium]MCP5013847.1 hypothetical protein [Ketobacter sp.]
MLNIAKSLRWFITCFLSAFFVVAGFKLADLAIEDPSMTIVICENGAGQCERIREPMNVGLRF